MDQVLLSSHYMGWGTPQSLFDRLNAEFHFDIDVAANHNNHKCDVYFTAKEDALLHDWRTDSNAKTAWLNPPYGREIGKWTRKAAEQAAKGMTVVLLIPARPDTRWWHELVTSPVCAEVRFIRGRVRFEGAPSGAPFPSAIVVLSQSIYETEYSYYENKGE